MQSEARAHGYGLYDETQGSAYTAVPPGPGAAQWAPTAWGESATPQGQLGQQSEALRHGYGRVWDDAASFTPGAQYGGRPLGGEMGVSYGDGPVVHWQDDVKERDMDISPGTSPAPALPPSQLLRPAPPPPPPESQHSEGRGQPYGNQSNQYGYTNQSGAAQYNVSGGMSGLQGQYPPTTKTTWENLDAALSFNTNTTPHRGLSSSASLRGQGGLGASTGDLGVSQDSGLQSSFSGSGYDDKFVTTGYENQSDSGYWGHSGDAGYEGQPATEYGGQPEYRGGFENQGGARFGYQAGATSSGRGGPHQTGGVALGEYGGGQGWSNEKGRGRGGLRGNSSGPGAGLGRGQMTPLMSMGGVRGQGVNRGGMMGQDATVGSNRMQLGSGGDQVRPGGSMGNQMRPGGQMGSDIRPGVQHRGPGPDLRPRGPADMRPARPQTFPRAPGGVGMHRVPELRPRGGLETNRPPDLRGPRPLFVDNRFTGPRPGGMRPAGSRMPGGPDIRAPGGPSPMTPRGLGPRALGGPGPRALGGPDPRQRFPFVNPRHPLGAVPPRPVLRGAGPGRAGETGVGGAVVTPQHQRSTVNALNTPRLNAPLSTLERGLQRIAESSVKDLGGREGAEGGLTAPLEGRDEENETAGLDPKAAGEKEEVEEEDDEEELDTSCCLLCDMKFAKPQAYHVHIRSISHNQKLEKSRGAVPQKKPPPPKPTPPKAVVAQKVPLSSAKGHGGDRGGVAPSEVEIVQDSDGNYCDVCCFGFSNTEVYNSHLQGLVHQQKLEEQKHHRAAAEQVMAEGQGEEDWGDGEEEWEEEGEEGFSSVPTKRSDWRSAAEKNLMLEDIGKPGSTSYVCEVCSVTCTGPKSYKMHLVGLKHQKKLKKSEEIDKFEKQRALKQQKGKEPQQDSEPNKKKKNVKVLRIQDEIDRCLLPLIGLDYMTEYQMEDASVEPRYICDLCASKMEANQVIHHLTGLRHRHKYFKFHGEREYGILWNLRRKSEKVRMADQFAAEAERREGRHTMRLKIQLKPFLDQDSASVQAAVVEEKWEEVTGEGLQPVRDLPGLRTYEEHSANYKPAAATDDIDDLEEEEPGPDAPLLSLGRYPPHRGPPDLRGRGLPPPGAFRFPAPPRGGPDLFGPPWRGPGRGGTRFGPGGVGPRFGPEGEGWRGPGHRDYPIRGPRPPIGHGPQFEQPMGSKRMREEYEGPPMRAEFDHHPMKDECDRPPIRDGYDRPPKRDGYDRPPIRDEYNRPMTRRFDEMLSNRERDPFYSGRAGTISAGAEGSRKSTVPVAAKTIDYNHGGGAAVGGGLALPSPQVINYDHRSREEIESESLPRKSSMAERSIESDRVATRITELRGGEGRQRFEREQGMAELGGSRGMSDRGQRAADGGYLADEDLRVDAGGRGGAPPRRGNEPPASSSDVDIEPIKMAIARCNINTESDAELALQISNVLTQALLESRLIALALSGGTDRALESHLASLRDQTSELTQPGAHSRQAELARASPAMHAALAASRRLALRLGQGAGGGQGAAGGQGGAMRQAMDILDAVNAQLYGMIMEEGGASTRDEPMRREEGGASARDEPMRREEGGASARDEPMRRERDVDVKREQGGGGARNGGREIGDAHRGPDGRQFSEGGQGTGRESGRGPLGGEQEGGPVTGPVGGAGGGPPVVGLPSRPPAKRFRFGL